MSILERLLGRGGSALATKRGPWPLSQTPGVLFGRGRSAGGVQVDEESALSLSGVFAAVNLLSRVIASLPLAVYRREPKRVEPAATHPAYRLLASSPNPEMTAVTFRRVMEWHRLLWGNAYAEIGWDGGGNVRSLWPVEAWRVKPCRDEQGMLYYRVDGRRDVYPADMLHIPLVSWDGVCGRSWVDYALSSLGVGLGSQEFAAKLFQNGARPGGVLEHPATPDPKQREQLKRDWQEAHAGPENAGRVAVIWGGWKYHSEDGSFAPEEAQLLETRRFATEEVARWLNIPPHLLRDLSRATFSNIEHQGIDFVQYSLGPILVDYEQEYDRKLLNSPSLYSKHNVNGLLRGDSQQRSAFYRDMFNIGVFSVNKILELEDLNPIGPEGDTHFVPLNMVAIQQAVKPPEPAPAPAPAPKPAPGRLHQAATDLLTTTLGRMVRVETNAVRRAADKPDKLFAWMDEFYRDHAQRLGEALGPVLRVCGLCHGSDHGTAEVAGAVLAWCEQSKADLLEVAGQVSAAQLPSAVEQLLQRWERERVPAVVARVMALEGLAA